MSANVDPSRENANASKRSASGISTLIVSPGSTGCAFRRRDLDALALDQSDDCVLRVRLQRPPRNQHLRGQLNLAKQAAGRICPAHDLLQLGLRLAQLHRGTVYPLVAKFHDCDIGATDFLLRPQQARFDSEPRTLLVRPASLQRHFRRRSCQSLPDERRNTGQLLLHEADLAILQTELSFKR